VATVLRRVRPLQSERRLRLGPAWDPPTAKSSEGQGPQEVDLVVDARNGQPIRPASLSKAWARFEKRHGSPTPGYMAFGAATPPSC
jgi:hypothetical protein